jgi:hypothetical protein
MLLIERNHLGEFFVNTGAMEALVEIFPEHLPIAVQNFFIGVAKSEIGQGPIVQEVGTVEALLQGSGVLGFQVNEHESVPIAHSDVIERIVGFVEIALFARGRRPLKLSLEIIGPAMIGTGDFRTGQTPLGLPYEN